MLPRGQTEVDRLVSGGKQIVRGATTSFLKTFEDSVAEVPAQGPGRVAPRDSGEGTRLERGPQCPSQEQRRCRR